MLSLLPAFLLVFLSFPLQSFSWASIPQTDPQFQRQFSSDFQIKIPRSRQSQTDGFFSENTSSGPEGDSIYTLYNYRNIDYQNSDIKKVVIQIAGQGRDAWSYFDDTLIALKNATARDESAHRGRKKSPTSTKSTSRNRSSSGSSSKKSQSNSRTRSDSSTRTSTRRRSSTSTSSPEPTSTSPSPSTSSPEPTSTSSSSTSTVDQDSNVPTLKESEVLIFCPMFMNLDDAGSYPISNPEDPFSSTSSALAWNVDDWIFGGDSILPNDYFWSGDEDEEQNSRRRRNQEGSESLEKRNVEKKSKTEFGRERDFEDGSDIRNSSTTLEHDYVWREDLKLNSTSSSSSIKRQTNPPPGISSFEVMDELIRYFSNSTSFPNLQTIIISGHSAGGQFVQRYALVGAVPSNQIPVHFTILNPGSYAYLTNWRAKNSDPSNIYTNKNGSTIIAPVIERSSNNTCDDFNDWKYGIGLKASDEVPDENLVSSDDNGDSIVDFGDGDGRGYDQRYLGEFVKESLIETNDVKSIVLRYGERIIHYLYGTDDHGVGSDSCMAMIQGVDHLSRGLNFIRHLTELKSFESLKNDADADDGDYNVSNSTNEAIEQNQTSKAKSNAPDNLSQIPAYMRSMVSSIGPGNGNFPSSQTVDYVPGVQHNPRDMFLSKQGLQRLFFINLDGEEIPKAVGDADKDSKYFYPNEATSSRLGFFKWIPVVALTASVSFLVL